MAEYVSRSISFAISKESLFDSTRFAVVSRASSIAGLIATSTSKISSSIKNSSHKSTYISSSVCMVSSEG